MATQHWISCDPCGQWGGDTIQRQNHQKKTKGKPKTYYLQDNANSRFASKEPTTELKESKNNFRIKVVMMISNWDDEDGYTIYVHNKIYNIYI